MHLHLSKLRLINLIVAVASEDSVLELEIFGFSYNLYKIDEEKFCMNTSTLTSVEFVNQAKGDGCNQTSQNDNLQTQTHHI